MMMTRSQLENIGIYKISDFKNTLREREREREIGWLVSTVFSPHSDVSPFVCICVYQTTK